MLGNMLSNLNQNMKVAFNICLLCETCILLLLLLLFPSALVLSPRPPTITYYFATLCVRGGVLLALDCHLPLHPFLKDLIYNTMRNLLKIQALTN